MSLKQDKITGVLSGHPFVITALLVLVVLVSTGMQINSNGTCCAIMICGYLLITGYGIYALAAAAVRSFRKKHSGGI